MHEGDCSLEDDVGGRIRRARRERGVSQAELAQTLAISGSYLSLIEGGRRPVKPDLLAAIATSFGVPVEILVGDVVDAQDDSLELDLKFAEIALRNGDVEIAEGRFQQILAASRPSSSRLKMQARIGLARAQEARGKLESAISAYESLLDELVEAPNGATATGGLDPSDVAVHVRISTSLCRLYSECGDLSRAIDVGERAMRLLPSDQSDPEVGEASVELVATLAGSHFERGDLTRAHLLAEQALARADASGVPTARAAAYWNSALIAEARGDVRSARRHIERARGLYAESDNLRAIALLKLVAAWLLLRDDEPALRDAEALLESALRDLPTVGSQIDIAYGEIELARCRMLLGDPEDAIRLAGRSIERLGDEAKLQGARARLTLGQARLLAGDGDGALDTFARATDDLRSTGADRQAAAAWRELAEALLTLGRVDEAIDAYRRASDAAGVTIAVAQPAPSDAAARRP